MAKIHFVKSGTPNSKFSEGEEIRTEDIIRIFKDFKISFKGTEEPYTENNKPYLADYRDRDYTIIVIDSDDINPSFPQKGFYEIEGITRQKVKSLLNPQTSN